MFFDHMVHQNTGKGIRDSRSPPCIAIRIIKSHYQKERK
jgi:hypothetical protein